MHTDETEWKGRKKRNVLCLFISIFFFFLLHSLQAQQIFFTEACDSANFSSRGWYDNENLRVTSAEHAPGSKGCLEFRFLRSASTPTSGGSVRRLFPGTDSVYINYWLKFSDNWVGSQQPYHPHELHFITDTDNPYIGPAATHLTIYIEHNGGRPLIAIQDALNIDVSRVGQDLTQVSEWRAVAGCNGSSDRYPEGDCYRAGTDYRNGKVWTASRVCFSDTEGKYYKNDWHFVEAFIKLNSVSDSRGVADGIIRYWFDGEPIIDVDDVMMRTAAHTSMKINQFLIAPYIGDGSPVEQSMWIDEITVADSRYVLTGMSEYSKQKEWQLSGNYPNPVTTTTIIPYTLATSERVKLEIFDLYGRKIATLIDDVQEAGSYTAEFDARSNGVVPAGSYLYRLSISSGSKSRMMTVLY